jgi:hypothetical protein
MKKIKHPLKTAVLFVVFFAGAALGGERDLTFFMWSDTHFGAYDGEDITRLNVIAMMNNMNKIDYPANVSVKGKVARPAFLLHLGDITENGKATQWNSPDKPDQQSYLQTINHLKPTIRTEETLGNHDSRKGENIRDKIIAKYRRPYHSFTEQGVHFVILDPYHWQNSAAPKLDDEQLAWLKKDLSLLPKGTPIILAMHVWPDTTTGDRSCHLDEESGGKLLNIIKGKNIIAWLHGHGHHSEHHIWNGIDMLSTGFCYYRPGCKDGTPTFMVFHITDNRLIAVDYNWDKKQWAEVYVDKAITRPTVTTTQPVTTSAVK